MKFAYLLPALVCGAMMVGCMLMMGRMHGRRDHDEGVDPGEVARLREENARMRTERDQRSQGRP